MSYQGLPLSAVHGLETGMWAALGRATTRELLLLGRPQDLPFYCWVALVLVRGLPDVLVVRRMSRIFTQAFYSVAVSATLHSVDTQGDTGLELLNLLSVYLLATTAHQAAFQGPAQYLLVGAVAKCLRETGQAAMPLAALAASLPAGIHPSFPELCRLVMVDVYMTALLSALPPTQVLLSVLALLYFTHPFATLFPPLMNLYTYAVFAATSDAQLRSLPLWELAYALAFVWRLAPDPVLARTACVAGGSVLVQLLVASLQPAMRNDPALVLMAVLLAIDILATVRSPGFA